MSPCSQALNMSASPSHGRQVEVQAAFRLAPAVGAAANTSGRAGLPFAVGLQLGTAGGAYTRVYINGSAVASWNGSLAVMQARAHA